MAATALGIFIHFAFVLAVSIRVMTRRHRDPASRIAWIAGLWSMLRRA